MLNYQKLGLDLKHCETAVNYTEILNKFKFIIMNDPINFDDNFDDLFGINDGLARFIIFDEAHNLFRNINNANRKGIAIYNTLMGLSNI